MKKVLTVIIPVYNMEKYIRQCLESLVIEEILDDLEVLVILDGSRDNSENIAREFEQKYSYSFRIVSKENGGHGSAINTGIALASGTYVKVLDSDDWVDREAFISLVKYLRNTEADVVWSNYYWFLEHRNKTAVQHRHPFSDVEYGKLYSFADIADKTFIKMHSMTIKTESFRHCNKTIDEHCYYVDVEFVIYPIPQIKTIVFLDEFVYMYRLGRPGQSMTLDKMRKNHRNHEKVLYSLLNFYTEQKQSGVPDPYLLYLEKGIAAVLSSHFKIFLSFPCSRSVCGQLRSLDKEMKTKYPEIYRNVDNTFVWALRKTNFLLYYPGHICLKLREFTYAI